MFGLLQKEMSTILAVSLGTIASTASHLFSNYLIACIFTSLDTIKKDVETAFLQTILAERDVCFIPQPVSNDKRSVSELLWRAAYGLVSANVKWKYFLTLLF